MKWVAVFIYLIAGSDDKFHSLQPFALGFHTEEQCEQYLMQVQRGFKESILEREGVAKQLKLTLEDKVYSEVEDYLGNPVKMILKCTSVKSK
mgnify:FL=1|tara:strand:+ start:200 stop:475 length:276 start_codon:yes stop_codon:yes gene_type:complete